MIRLENVNKYFYHHKKNEIHVINNTNLSFDKAGLVALLGPSGCGKTTLLNAIGGLDKINDGKIYVDGERITKRTATKIDNIRNLNIGYIFQDYHLLDDYTVYDNIALVLKMIGLKDKEEIKKRVYYVLEKVGMYRYRNRMASMLSGGERQRVGIARAIVKNPKIIIADEPTGNLDSKNTIDIMNIIKSISNEKLVILVTHEKELAYFYASRIIELQDGVVIKDKSNVHNNDLDYRMDNKIYLKDIKNLSHLKKDNCEINYYSENKEKLDLDIVIRNGNLYIQNNTKTKVEIVDSYSNIEFVNDNYKAIKADDYKSIDFNVNFNNAKKPKYSSIYNPITMLTNGFKKVFGYTVFKKILLLGFLVSSMFILYSVSNIFATIDIKDEKFVTQNKDYLTISSKDTKVDDYLSYEKEELINYIMPGDSSVSFQMIFDDYYQFNNMITDLKGSLSDINMIQETDLTYGVIPSDNHEIVIDEMCYSNMTSNVYTNVIKQTGILDISEMIGRKVKINKMGEFKIVGIVSKGSPSIYTDRNLFINIIANSTGEGESYVETKDMAYENTTYLDYELVKDSIKIKKGRYPKKNYEIMVNISHQFDMPLNKTITNKINGKKLKVVGYFDDVYSSDYYLVNQEMIKYDLITTKDNIIVYPKDKDKAIELFRGKEVNIEDAYTKSRIEYVEGRRDSVTITLIIASIILVISFVEIFLMIRASFLSRIKEIGILRAIGMKKRDIYSIFLGEILAITTLAGIPGYLFMTYILTQLVTITYLKDMYVLNTTVLVLSLGLIYLVNILVGLIPVYNTLRKTPASILSRNDVD